VPTPNLEPSFIKSDIFYLYAKMRPTSILRHVEIYCKSSTIHGVNYLSSRCHIHQHFMLAFFIPNSFVQLFSNYSLGLSFFGGKNICEKAAHKMLMKLTTGKEYHGLITFFGVLHWQSVYFSASYFS
jgi:hypothetical protein